MISAKLLKRVFGMEINACAGCGGKLKVIASIEEPEVIAKILAHLEKTARIKPSVGFRSARGHRRHRCD